MPKVIKNERWTVKELEQKVAHNQINKPKFQRKKKWHILPKRENHPSNRNYIDYLYRSGNSVFPITVGYIDGRYANIDGNNRINAILHFLRQPFSLYPEYLDQIFQFIDTLGFCSANNSSEKSNSGAVDAIIILKEIIRKMTYSDIMTFKYTTYFTKQKGNAFYVDYMKEHRDALEPHFEDLATKFKINGEYQFNVNVIMAVNVFEGYAMDELNKFYEDINRFNTKLTETELLASQLYAVVNFEIKDSVMRAELNEHIAEYYKNRMEDEILQCYEYCDQDSSRMNAFDFMVGFQNWANSQCAMIGEVLDNDGLSLFFKVYKTLYSTETLETNFTSQNVNEFIDKIKSVVAILKNIHSRVFMENLVSDNKLFDSCNKYLGRLTKNNVFVIIISIIGYLNIREPETNIVKSIEKCILYHFCAKEIAEKDIRKQFQANDKINLERGRAYIDNLSTEIYKHPGDISRGITEELMSRLLRTLIRENVDSRSVSAKPTKRRPRKFFEKAVLYYYYKTRVPTEFLTNKFWIEHICPFSSGWDGEIDIDRLGNILPIIDHLNRKRSDKHISEYAKHDTRQFIRFVDDIIPSGELYNSIVTHTGSATSKNPRITDIAKYNELCARNEDVMSATFVRNIFA
jgi:hypothetical protein